MLKHWIVICICAAAIAILLLFGVNLWAAVLPVLAVKLAIDAWGAINVNSNYYINVLCKGDGQTKSVALTFDDGPAENHTAAVLDILKEHSVPATFFCIGKRVEETPGLVKRAHEEGHLIGNHSYTHHTLFDLFPTYKMKAELRKTNAVIEAAIGLKPALFRPPYGVTNPMLASAIKAVQLTPAGWSIRSFDTVIKKEDELFDRVTRRITAGDIFLFHDTSAATVKILPALIKQLKREGFAIKRLDEVLNVPAYA